MAFRDPHLYKVFELALIANRELQEKQSTEQRLREQVLCPLPVRLLQALCSRGVHVMPNQGCVWVMTPVHGASARP